MERSGQIRLRSKIFELILHRGSKSGSVYGGEKGHVGFGGNPYSKPVGDALDKERERLDSKSAQQRDYEAYQAYQANQHYDDQDQYDQNQYNDQYENYNYQQYEEPAPVATKKPLSYMEQKKEELRRYQEAQRQSNPSSSKPPAYDIEEALAREMKKMSLENEYSAGPIGDYQDRHALRDYNRNEIPKAKPVMDIPAGGVSIRKQSEENKFSLSGYNDREMMNVSKKSGHSVYETSSGAYGNYDNDKLGKHT